jgi:hypothetical protein
MGIVDESIVKAEETIQKVTPAGYVAEFVEPPWRGKPAACRGCRMHPLVGSERRWTVAILTHIDRPQKKMRWSVAMLCEKCTHSKVVRNGLAVDVFLPMLPPGPIPTT